MAAERLVFRPDTFDLVMMGEALAYLSDPTDALAEFPALARLDSVGALAQWLATNG